MVQKLSEEIQSLKKEDNSQHNRMQMSQEISKLTSITDDYYTIYHMWKRKDDECEAVWKERCWFEQKWNEERGKCLLRIIIERLLIHGKGFKNRIKQLLQ